MDYIVEIVTVFGMVFMAFVLGMLIGVGTISDNLHKEAVARGFGQWEQSKDNPAKNVFVWKDMDNIKKKGE